VDPIPPCGFAQERGTVGDIHIPRGEYHAFQKAPRRAASRLRAAIQVELLEVRSLLSCVLSDGVLTVEGSNRGDTIAVIQTVDPGAPEDPTDDTQMLAVTFNGERCGWHALTEVTGLVINAGNGHDTVTIADELLIGATVHGGNGKDAIDGGGGADELHGDNGKDVLDGDAGNDQIWGGNGSDRLDGDLGDDQLHGDNGPDVLVDPDDDDHLDGGRGHDTINDVPEPDGHGHGHGHG
jgi:Ca2+-binding RTX toxin-like protein